MPSSEPIQKKTTRNHCIGQESGPVPAPGSERPRLAGEAGHRHHGVGRHRRGGYPGRLVRAWLVSARRVSPSYLDCHRLADATTRGVGRVVIRDGHVSEHRYTKRADQRSGVCARLSDVVAVPIDGQRGRAVALGGAAAAGQSDIGREIDPSLGGIRPRGSKCRLVVHGDRTGRHRPQHQEAGAQAQSRRCAHKTRASPLPSCHDAPLALMNSETLSRVGLGEKRRRIRVHVSGCNATTSPSASSHWRRAGMPWGALLTWGNPGYPAIRVQRPRGHPVECTHQNGLPVHFGSRRSSQARTPSRASGVPMTRRWYSVSR